MVMVGLAPFDPINQVTPFTYRDNDTYLSLLYGLRNFANDLVDQINEVSTNDTTNLNTAVEGLTAQINQAIETVNAYADTGDNTIRTEIAGTLANVTTSLADFTTTLGEFDTRLTDMYATSNAGLDDRVTTAETLVSAIDSRTVAMKGLADPLQTPTEMLAGLADMQNGSVTMAIASDSTGNDPTDWVRIWSKMFGDLLTNTALKREYKLWNDTTQTWNASTIDQAGTPIPASGGAVVADTFTRTGEMVGSAPDTGPVWQGKTGIWATDGTCAKQISTTLTGAIITRILNGFGSPIRNNSLVANLILVTSASAASQQYRFYVGAPAKTSDSSGVVGGVYVFLAVSASGAVSGGLASTINAVNTSIATFASFPGVAAVSATPQNITVTMTLNADRTISGSVQKDGQTAATLTATITEAEYAWLGGYVAVTAATFATPGYKIESLNVSTPAIPAPPQPGLTIANGSVPGSTVLYHKTRILTMWPTKPDILVIATGHNDALFSPEEFLANVQGFLDACTTAWGSLPKILISSENPQRADQPGSVFHALRQAALRQWAASKGYQYLPVFELFTNGVASMNNADGIHPSTPAAYPLTVGDTTRYGSVEWAQLMQNFVTARRYRA